MASPDTRPTVRELMELIDPSDELVLDKRIVEDGRPLYVYRGGPWEVRVWGDSAGVQSVVSYEDVMDGPGADPVRTEALASELLRRIGPPEDYPVRTVGMGSEEFGSHYYEWTQEIGGVQTASHFAVRFDDRTGRLHHLTRTELMEPQISTEPAVDRDDAVRLALESVGREVEVVGSRLSLGLRKEGGQKLAWTVHLADAQSVPYVATVDAHSAEVLSIETTGKASPLGR